MHAQRIQKILSVINIPVTDPEFFAHVFKSIAKFSTSTHLSVEDDLKQACQEEYVELSQRLDDTQIQESCSVRNVLKTRGIAELLINDEGDVNLSLLPIIIQSLKDNLYVLGPQRQYDGPRHAHILHVLTLLSTTPELMRLVKRIGKPHQHPLADQIIRDTLDLAASVPVTDAHARRATLAAWMCTLRQNIGSCFATAPAIIIHDEQPEQFLLDIYDLLGTGRLKRTFGGIEYTVPLSTSWGGGDLRKPILLFKNSHDKSSIWNAPGLIAALESIHLLDTNASIKSKVDFAKSLVLNVLPDWSAHQPFLIISSEEIIRRILMHHYQLTEQDIRDYENRPRGMVHTSLLMQSTFSGGKADTCAVFLTQFQIAMNAFKLLADNALLKSWEFTIASFSEIKSDFGRWNLYSSLGLRPEEPGGIGACLYEHIKRKLDHSNQQVQDYQFEYEHMFLQVKQLESRMRNAASEKEAQWLRVEYQSKSSEFYLLEELRNKAHARAEALAQLLNIFVDEYDRLFPEYFQEVYDADMHEVSVGPYDDSPAGFRLLYKHGRNNTAQWMRIKTSQEFVEALANFFTSTEREISSIDVLQGMETDVSEIVTAIVNHVRTQEFLETAFHRMAAAHHRPAVKNPLENLDKIDKKPWAYTSGGAITTLISSYYRHEEKPKEVARWVENPMELFVFFVDVLKQIPYKMMEEYLDNPNKAMLMHSPTHAFNLKPGLTPFKNAWQTDSFTYTWLRDNLTQPMERFVNFISLDEEQMNFIIDRFVDKIPQDFHHYFRKTFSRVFGPMDTSEFRNHILDGISYERGLQLNGRGVLTADEIDSAFYSWLPLCPYSQISKHVEAIFAMIPEIGAEKEKLLKEVVENLTERIGHGYITAQQLQDICLALLCLVNAKTTSPLNFPAKVVQAAQSLGFAMPAPIIFADTNWVKDMFGFVVNPGTQELEFWRVDPIGRGGSPMSIWKQWLNGSRKDGLWGVFINPYEYSYQARYPKGMLI